VREFEIVASDKVPIGEIWLRYGDEIVGKIAPDSMAALKELVDCCTDAVRALLPIVLDSFGSAVESATLSDAAGRPILSTLSAEAKPYCDKCFAALEKGIDALKRCGIPIPGQCQVCGCTDAAACMLPSGETCAWADELHTVCSKPDCVQAWTAENAEKITAYEG
jgi:hypothetical protein